jgi:hypothetical protein
MCRCLRFLVLTVDVRCLGHSQGCSIAEIADAILSQERFKCVPLHWIELSLEHLLASQLVVQREDSQRFSIK